MLAAAAVGCLPPSDQEGLSEDGDTPRFAVLDVAVRDLKGAPWEPLEAPRRPHIIIRTSAKPADDTAPVWLLRGRSDEVLVDDLRQNPLRVAHLERAVPSETALRSDGWDLRPKESLEAGSSYTLAVGRWAHDGRQRLEEPYIAHVRASHRADAGASLADTWPAEGSSVVPPNIESVALRFDGALDPATLSAGVAIRHRAGAVPATVQAASCPSVGWPDGFCVRLSLGAPLAAGEDYRIELSEDLLDRTGAPLGPMAIGFRIANEPDRKPPSLVETPCAIDESAWAGGCIRADDESVVVRVQADEPVQVTWTIADRAVRATAARGQAVLRRSELPADTALATRLALRDLAGHTAEHELHVRTTPPLATLSIVEVRADPLGPEPAQEYVELWNYGEAAVDLAGFLLSDRLDHPGRAFPRSLAVAPGQRVLWVASTFDPENPADPPVPPGAVIARSDAGLVSSGIRNSGERLFLRDPQQRRVSGAPAIRSGPGACLVRVAADMRTGERAAFEVSGVGLCTPGAPPKGP